MSSSRIRIWLVSLLFVFVFVFGAVAASTASAKRVWTVEGAKLAVGKTKSLKVVKNSPSVLKAGAEEIECNKIAIEAGNTISNVEVEGKLTGRDTGTLLFTECKNKNKPLCTAVTVASFVSPTFLVENTLGTKTYDIFRPKGATELTPAEVATKGQTASKENEEKLKSYVKITQTGTGCTAPETSTAEGNAFAAEILPEGSSTQKKFVFPCPTPITPVNPWNGVKEVALKLKVFGVAAKECISEIEVELTTKEAFALGTEANGAPLFTAEPERVQFANNIKVGETQKALVILTNVSGGALTPSVYTVEEGTIFQVTDGNSKGEFKCNAEKIANKGTCEFEVTFKPDEEGKKFGGRYELERIAGPWVVVPFSGVVANRAERGSACRPHRRCSRGG